MNMTDKYLANLKKSKKEKEQIICKISNKKANIVTNIDEIENLDKIGDILEKNKLSKLAQEELAQDGRVGHALTPSCKSTGITTNC